ncbi:c-type cytochrome domain-containing protein [Chitinophaga niabensis]|uniref:Uncharacterized membrane protein n=1 Tax=Chitinophaga niabensis TaxID=536979 RepID=A0A1N6DT58_9BACT|nr:c-type cytochrome domain-containing protein [Chitinophaga niabensis]SIN73982.1 Uncharacterized membrane protein [Chitinophaga niabensis]
MKLLDIFTFSGHLHPLIVHLPIGFILLATLFNLLSYAKRFAYLKQAVPITLLIGFIAAVLACIFGYLLSLKGDYDTDALSKHKLSGISLAAIAGLLYFTTTKFFLKEIPLPRPLFSLLLTGLVILMSYSGHQGASLTHGSDYLTMQVLLQKERVKPSSAEEALLFEDVIQPILQNKCVQCHRDGKSKGDLSLENMEDILKGGKSGPAIIPGNPDSSELIRRIMLDEDHKDFMPADGKPPLTKNELRLIRWWVKEGKAAQGKTVASLDSVILQPMVAQYLGMETQQAVNITQHINPGIPISTDTSLIANLRKTGLHVRLMLLQPLMLDVTLPTGSGVKAALIKPEIHKLAKHIIWLNLSGNGLTDDDLDFLPALINLEKLRLDKNPVTDKISHQLITLKHLEALNLNETNITAAAIDQLKKNTAIKRVYSWNTGAQR